MNWTDFFFGAVAGVSLCLTVAALFLFHIMRPYLRAAAEKVKSAKAKPSRAKNPVWPVSFDGLNYPTGEGPPDGNS